MSYFFNSIQLRVPYNHYLHLLRIFPIAFNYIPAVEDFHSYFKDKSGKKRMTFIMLLSQWIALAEFLIFLKYYQQELYLAKTPNHVVTIWIVISIGMIGLFSISLQGWTKKLNN